MRFLLEKDSTGFRYRSVENGYEIMKYSGQDKDVIIPSTHKGKPVVSIHRYAFNSDLGRNIKSVIIPNTIVNIGDEAFNYCGNLINLSIGSGVKYIGSGAFNNCGLRNLEIPKNVERIGVDAFSHNNNLTNIKINNGIIEDKAFGYCKNLSSVEIGNGVTNIKGNAFAWCPSLTNITVNSANQVYDSRDNCNAIIETNSDTLIVSCSNSIIPDNIKNIGDYAFYSSDRTDITIPKGVKEIGAKAFFDCTNLTSIKIPNNVTRIGSSAFSFCSNLTSIEIPSSVTSIGRHAFSYCNNLSQVTIPDSVKEIGEYAFGWCGALKKVNINNNLLTTAKIAKDAFDNTPYKPTFNKLINELDLQNKYNSLNSISSNNKQIKGKIKTAAYGTWDGEWIWDETNIEADNIKDFLVKACMFYATTETEFDEDEWAEIFDESAEDMSEQDLLDFLISNSHFDDLSEEPKVVAYLKLGNKVLINIPKSNFRDDGDDEDW